MIAETRIDARNWGTKLENSVFIDEPRYSFDTDKRNLFVTKRAFGSP
jgi:hypothetical protein